MNWSTEIGGLTIVKESKVFLVKAGNKVALLVGDGEDLADFVGFDGASLKTCPPVGRLLSPVGLAVWSVFCGDAAGDGVGSCGGGLLRNSSGAAQSETRKTREA